MQRDHGNGINMLASCDRDSRPSRAPNLARDRLNMYTMMMKIGFQILLSMNLIYFVGRIVCVVCC